MYIPKNHERMQTISEIVREGLSNHEIAGGTYYDDAAMQIAGHAIQTCMPGLRDMHKARVVMEANTGILLDGTHSTKYDGVRVEARLERVALQPLVTVLDESDPDLPLTYTEYDLFAVLHPQYVDPDPQDIVFGDELFVPFREMELFEEA